MKLYNVFLPEQDAIPVIASLPHSGTYVPRDIRNQLRQGFPPILAPVDWHLERLYDFLPSMGIIVIQATHSRYVVNLNRDLREPLFGPEREFVIPENTCFGKPLYDNKPDRGEVEERIGKYYLPYHRRLTRILDKAVRDFNHVYLVDLHGYHSGPEVDICLGNVNETTCSESLIGGFEKSFLKQGFSVVRNDKWTGGHITNHYGSMDNIESLQIEFRFPAYLEGNTFKDEEVPEWDTDRFRNAKIRIQKVFNQVVKELL